ncbi:MAG: hypothetical protein QOJ69_2378 [Actinomycetota bacterium]|jgi:hypothetical protein|nr:hypothetical protein [Actinomycetota bacterium]MEA2844707.1 hypothetical protein [Actinomycetota bacterium]
MAAAANPAPGRITRADIEAKLRELRGDVEDTGEVVKEAGKGLAIGGIILLLILVFLLGKRRGRRKSTVVEIRRI